MARPDRILGGTHIGGMDETAWLRLLRAAPAGRGGEVFADRAADPQCVAMYSPPTPGGGWVEGRRMLTISEEKLKRIAPSVLEKMVLRKLKEVCNGGN